MQYCFLVEFDVFYGACLDFLYCCMPSVVLVGFCAAECRRNVAFGVLKVFSDFFAVLSYHSLNSAYTAGTLIAPSCVLPIVSSSTPHIDV